MSELPENTVEVLKGGYGSFGPGCGSVVRVNPDAISIECDVDGVGPCRLNLADLVTLLNPPKPEKGPRLFTGTPPTWEQLCGCPSFVDVAGVRWLVSARDDYRTPPKWRDIKVFAAEPVPNKGNYFLSWNSRAKVFAFGSQFKVLEAHRPEVLAAVSALLSKVNWPK